MLDRDEIAAYLASDTSVDAAQVAWEAAGMKTTDEPVGDFLHLRNFCEQNAITTVDKLNGRFAALSANYNGLVAEFAAILPAQVKAQRAWNVDEVVLHILVRDKLRAPTSA